MVHTSMRFDTLHARTRHKMSVDWDTIGNLHDGRKANVEEEVFLKLNLGIQ
jgi:hypothetical protein